MLGIIKGKLLPSQVEHYINKEKHVHVEALAEASSVIGDCWNATNTLTEVSKNDSEEV